MAAVTIRYATFENGAVTIDLTYDDQTLVVTGASWFNGDAVPYQVTLGTRTVSIPVGTGSVSVPGKQFKMVPSPDGEGLIFNQPTNCGRA